MSNHAHYFDDVPELQQAQFGALGGEGSAALEQTKTTIDQRGIHTICACGQCGRPAAITVSWFEAVVGSRALIPEGWKAEPANNSLSPFEGVGCPSCQYWVQLLFTPAELGRYVQQAIGQGLLSQQDVSAWSQQIAAARGGGRQPGPPQQQYRR